MDIQKIKDMQYKVLVMTEEILLNSDIELDKDFKKRVFEIVKYLIEIENHIKREEK